MDNQCQHEEEQEVAEAAPAACAEDIAGDHNGPDQDDGVLENQGQGTTTDACIQRGPPAQGQRNCHCTDCIQPEGNPGINLQPLPSCDECRNTAPGEKQQSGDRPRSAAHAIQAARLGQIRSSWGWGIHRRTIHSLPWGLPFEPQLSASLLIGIGRERRMASSNRLPADYLRWRILARMRRFLRPIFLRPLPVFFVPMQFNSPSSVNGCIVRCSSVCEKSVSEASSIVRAERKINHSRPLSQGSRNCRLASAKMVEINGIFRPDCFRDLPSRLCLAVPEQAVQT